MQTALFFSRLSFEALHTTMKVELKYSLLLSARL